MARSDRNRPQQPLIYLAFCGLKAKRYLNRGNSQRQTVGILRTGRQTADRNKHQTLRRLLRGE